MCDHISRTKSHSDVENKSSICRKYTGPNLAITGPDANWERVVNRLPASTGLWVGLLLRLRILVIAVAEVVRVWDLCYAMVEKEKKLLASPAMGKRGAGHLRAGDSSPGAPSRANSTEQQWPTPSRYKGVRAREWGKWVTETSDTQTKKRIWLGSFDTEEMAARAYDAAVVSLKGPNAEGLNFPDSPPRAVSRTRVKKDIQNAAKAAGTASAQKATPLVTSKKKKVSSPLSTCKPHTEEYTPDEGEPNNDVREESASPPLEGSRKAATMAELNTWIDNMEVYNDRPYMSHEFWYVGRP